MLTLVSIIIQLFTNLIIIVDGDKCEAKPEQDNSQNQPAGEESSHGKGMYHLNGKNGYMGFF